MNAGNNDFSMVHINVITGFLGAGKTTLIRHLLAHKPVAERWGVLVNEFGEVGIDGALLSSPATGAVIKEVPGGCLCCANGLPFQIALNQLLAAKQLDRLLIEPTGLGHPLEILALLAQPCYQAVSQLGSTLTLVDARKIKDPRYTEHALFNQQLLVADYILAAKADTYSADEYTQLNHYVTALRPKAPFSISAIEQGAGQIAWLQGAAQAWRLNASTAQARKSDSSAASAPLLSLAPQYNSQGLVFKHKYADGFHAYGWAFAPELVFSSEALEHCLLGLSCERLKAVMITHTCVRGFNLADGVLSVTELDDCFDSRLELISLEAIDVASLEARLLASLVAS
ncbi:GTP-binding protein [Simiduia curdlanivorans]|uniref:CobW family GTP-binding protein n=1 Tax=Simiduia curdlanivorans TaxID=1492769 RepID=A0ABV8V309_9GAMM|nr:GTP-binding protein [Simiduia curdlanivorans]MDN3641009.1 GTP-binding protein [Simiduia curdlanivorans]